MLMFGTDGRTIVGWNLSMAFSWDVLAVQNPHQCHLRVKKRWMVRCGSRASVGGVVGLVEKRRNFAFFYITWRQRLPLFARNILEQHKDPKCGAEDAIVSAILSEVLLGRHIITFYIFLWTDFITNRGRSPERRWVKSQYLKEAVFPIAFPGTCTVKTVSCELLNTSDSCLLPTVGPALVGLAAGFCSKVFTQVLAAYHWHSACDARNLCLIDLLREEKMGGWPIGHRFAARQHLSTRDYFGQCSNVSLNLIRYVNNMW